MPISPPRSAAEIARKVGIATIKFADLSNHRTTDYIFDLERFSRFEGKTGPYLQYAAVRIQSIAAQGSSRRRGGCAPRHPFAGGAPALALQLLSLGDVVDGRRREAGAQYACASMPSNCLRISVASTANIMFCLSPIRACKAARLGSVPWFWRL